MNIEYWLLETEEDMMNYEMSLDIASPNDMAKAIQRVRDLAEKFENEEPKGEAVLRYGLAAQRIYAALEGDNPNV